MPGKTNEFSNDLLKLIFHGVDIAGLARNALSPFNTLYLSLHIADPTDAAPNGQASGEANYTGYARMPLTRSSAGWTISGKTVSPVEDIVFGKATAGTMEILYAGVGTSFTGNGKLLYSGAISPSIAVTPGVRPVIEAGSVITEE